MLDSRITHLRELLIHKFKCAEIYFIYFVAGFANDVVVMSLRVSQLVAHCTIPEIHLRNEPDLFEGGQIPIDRDEVGIGLFVNFFYAERPMVLTQKSEQRCASWCHF